MPIKRVLPGSPLDYPCFTNSSDTPRAIPSSSMAFQRLACRGHHRRNLTPMEDGAGFQVMPHAAHDHRQ